MSVIHPGSSINFDATNLRHNDEDENEMLQEELRQQKELRELLSAELSDDLLDDDHSSVNDSHRSLPQDVSNEGQETVDSPVISSSAPWVQGVNGGNYNNIAQQQPITSTPGDQLHNDQYYGRNTNGYDYNPQNQFNYTNGQQQQYYDPSYGIVTSQTQPWHHNQQGYGNDVVFQQQRNNGVGQYVQYNQNGAPPRQIDQRIEETGEYPFAERGEVEGREDYGDAIDGNLLQQQQFIQYKPERNILPAKTNSLTPSPGSKASFRQSFPPNFERKKHTVKNNRYDSNSGHDMSMESSPADYETHERDKLQKQFTAIANENRDENSRQMAQLQILYKARGKKIDELTRELDEIKSENAREKRILNHQLAMTKDQKDGMGTSLEESQRLVQTKERGIDDLKGKLDAKFAENESLKSNKNELLTKIQVSERTIESLHEQLTQMSHSESIERAREQHDAVLNAATQRHDLQVLELTTQLDEFRQEMNDKNEEIEKLRFHLNKISRESEQTLLDKTDTINRLTKSLEEAQNQCQGLLAGSNETAFARHQVTDLLQERKQNEGEIALLKMQMRDAEEHLKLFENALQLGAGSGRQHHHVRGGSLSDSLNELMLGHNDVARKLDWKTPQIMTPVFESGSHEELIDGLRKELQRALNCNKSKRDEVTKLKQQRTELETESSHWRTRADEAQTKLKLNISLPAEKSNDENRDSFMIHELEEKTREAECEAKRLDKTCTEVKQRMAEMIQEHDQDKQDAVERCERTMMQLHEDAKHALRDEIISEYEQKIYEISVEHDSKMRELSLELEELQHELYDVKQSYVHVCSEKDKIQTTTTDELVTEYEKEKEELVSTHENSIKELENMLEKLEKEMKEKIKEEKEKCGTDWENEREKIIQSLKEEWETEKESDFTQRMETQIALAKVNWFEEFANSKQEAILFAVKQGDVKWTERIKDLKNSWNEESTLQKEKELNDEREKWNVEKEEEIRQLLDEFQSEKESAVKMATCMAELNKTLQKENLEDANEELLENKLKEAEEALRKDHERLMKEEKDSWKKYQDEVIQEAKESWKNHQDKLMKEARDSWEREHENQMRNGVDNVRKEMEKEAERKRKTLETVMEKAVQEVRKICDHEKQNALKQKSMDMEKEIKKLQEQHRTDYELFVEEHKNKLTTFLENEKTRTTSTPVCRDATSQAEILPPVRKNSSDDKQKLWVSEKENLLEKNKNEVDLVQRKYETKFDELRREIQQLMSEKNNISTELQRTESRLQIQGERAAFDIEKEKSQLKIENERLQNEISLTESRIAKLTEQNKEDMNRLKDRMREEYRRWKKERSGLISKLKENAAIANPSYRPEISPIQTTENTSCKFCQNTQDNHSQILKHKDEAMRKATSELTDIYADTLKMIKDEMMSYIGDTRGRTKDTISQDRKRTASKLRSHYTRAIQRMKPQKEIQAQLLQKLKLFESDSESRPESPVNYETIKTTYTSKPSSEKILQTRNTTNSDARPKSLHTEQFFNKFNDENHFPTKLTPESEQVQRSSAFRRQSPHIRDPPLMNSGNGDRSHFPQSFAPITGACGQDLPQYRDKGFQGEINHPVYVTDADNLDNGTQRGNPQYRPQFPSTIDFSPRHAQRGFTTQNYSDFRNFREAPDTASLGGTYKPPRSGDR